MARLLLHRTRVRARRLVPAALRPLATRALLAAAATALRGDAVACPCCGGRYRRFLPYPSRLCPGGGASERQRALALLLEGDGELLPAGGRLLHVGPERALHEALRARAAAYIAFDLGHPLATHVMDVRRLSFADASFDAVLSCTSSRRCPTLNERGTSSYA